MLLSTLLLCLTLSYEKLSEQALDDVEVLSSTQMAGRKTGSQGAHSAANYIKQRFVDIGLSPLNNHFFQPFEYQSGFFSKAYGKNVIATLISDKQLPYIIVTAHYDHLGQQGRRIFNGADDNASGVAAMLAVATRLKARKNRYNYVFVATDAEEKGLHGARAFLSEPTTKSLNIILNINLDMLGISSRRQRLLALYSKELKPYKELIEIRHPIHKAHIKMTRGRGFFDDANIRSKHQILMASDHGVFRKAGIPFLYFGVGTHKHYHQDTDNFDNIDKKFYKANIENLVLLITQLDLQFGTKHAV